MPIYWAFLTFMLLKPGTHPMNLPFDFNGIDKLVHIAIFALLGFLFRVTLPALSWRDSLCILIAYGILTEIGQGEMHAGRSEEGLDLLADTLGILVGFYFAKKIAIYIRM